VGKESSEIARDCLLMNLNVEAMSGPRERLRFSDSDWNMTSERRGRKPGGLKARPHDGKDHGNGDSRASIGAVTTENIEGIRVPRDQAIDIY